MVDLIKHYTTNTLEEKPKNKLISCFSNGLYYYTYQINSLDANMGSVGWAIRASLVQYDIRIKWLSKLMMVFSIKRRSWWFIFL
jgi:hypothetical protein